MGRRPNRYLCYWRDVRQREAVEIRLIFIAVLILRIIIVAMS